MSFIKKNSIWLDLKDSVLDLPIIDSYISKIKARQFKKFRNQSLKETIDLCTTNKTVNTNYSIS